MQNPDGKFEYSNTYPYSDHSNTAISIQKPRFGQNSAIIWLAKKIFKMNVKMQCVRHDVRVF